MTPLEIVLLFVTACLLIALAVTTGLLKHAEGEIRTLTNNYEMPPNQAIFDQFVAVIEAEVNARMESERGTHRYTKARNHELRQHWLTLANRNVELAKRLTDKQLNDEITDRIAMHRKQNSTDHPEYMYEPTETQFDYMYHDWWSMRQRTPLDVRVAREVHKRGGRDYLRTPGIYDHWMD